MAKGSAKGTLLQVNQGTAGWQTVAELRTIGFNGATTEELDVTTHDSTGNAREKVAQWINYGNVSANGLYDPADATQGSTGFGLIALFQAQSQQSWRIQPQGTTAGSITFTGYVGEFSATFNYEEAMAFSSSITLNGPAAF